MILTIEQIGLSLEVEDKLLNKLLEIGKTHYPIEFGGFLIGYYSEDNKHLYITDTILPKKFQASKYSFERSTKGIENEFTEFTQIIRERFTSGNGILIQIIALSQVRQIFPQ